MGAMENKSLNVFNSRLVLASPTTATDVDYGRIEGVRFFSIFFHFFLMEKNSTPPLTLSFSLSLPSQSY